MSRMHFNPIEFLKWWLIDAPKRIFTVLYRFTILINNALGFSLNLSLMFTPLFGDYTKAGRFIGFFVRIFETIFGFAFVAIMVVITLISPFIWWIIPLVAIYYLKLIAFILFLLVFVARELHKSDRPTDKATEVSGRDVIKSFRPIVKEYYETFSSTDKQFFPKFFELPSITYLMKKCELNSFEFMQKLQDAPSVNFMDVATTAHKIAIKQKCRFVETEHLFLALIQNVNKIEIILATYGSTMDLIESAVLWIVSEREEKSRVNFWQEDYLLPKMGGIGRGMTGRVTPMLDSVSEDFTRSAKYQPTAKFITHSVEIDKIAQILGSSKVNVLIVGEPGSGKTTVVRNLAYKIVKGTEYESLKFKRIVNIQAGALVAGARNPGEMANKIQRVMDDVLKSGDIVLFVDEIHNLVAAGGNDSAEGSNMYTMLEPYLSSGRIQFIGATNKENYRKFIEPNGAFARLFQIVEIPPASKEETLEVLKTYARQLEIRYGVTITIPALKKIIDLSDKLMHDRVFPDKAIDILSRTVSSTSKTGKYLTQEDAAKEVSQMTHIPVSSITEDESQKLLNIDEEMKKRVIGQDGAIKQIGGALKRARVGIRNEGKPIASFLFVGTTGVGKTETAKALAKTYFGSEKTMIRLDMSEYQQLDSIDRLIGAPDGKSKGVLTEAVRSAPFALVLLDEIEKAHPNILLTFLQVLDDGRLTDSSGRVIDFTNTIIIATSNVGTRSIQELSGKGVSFEELSQAGMRDVREKFAPEFLNRFSGIIVFRPLTLNDVQRIAILMLERVRGSAEAKGIKIFFKPELIIELVTRGFSPEWGARPLGRVIEDTVESYIATKILAKEMKMGDTVYLGSEVFEA